MMAKEKWQVPKEVIDRLCNTCEHAHIIQEGHGYERTKICPLLGCDCDKYVYVSILEEGVVLEDGFILGTDERKAAGLKPFEETRTTSSAGGEKGVKPERMSLIPVEALEIMGRLYGFGAEKYAAHNWRKGYEWSKSYDALQRHAGAFWRGEDLDEETGLPHLAGVVFHAFALMIYMEEHPEFDDRYTTTIKKAEESESSADKFAKAMNMFMVDSGVSREVAEKLLRKGRDRLAE